MEDVRTTFDLNKEIIIKMFFDIDSSLNLENKSTIYQLHKENSIYSNRNAEFFEERRKKDKELLKITIEIEKKRNQEDKFMKKSKSTKILFQKKIKEKEFQIEKLKTDIEKLVTMKETKFKKSVFVTYAANSNFEIYLELLHTREIIGKLYKKIEKEKIINRRVQIDLNLIETEVENYKISNGILIESPTKSKMNNESDNLFLYEESIIDESIDISRYSNILKEKDLLNFEENTDDIYFPDKVTMKKVGDNVTMKKLNFGSIQEKYKNIKNINIVENKRDLNYFEKKLKDPVKVDGNKFQDTEGELIKKIIEAENELSQADEKIVELTQKNLKYLNAIKEFLSKIKKLKDNIKIADCKILLLKNQIWENSENKLSEFEEDENIFQTESLDYSNDS